MLISLVGMVVGLAGCGSTGHRMMTIFFNEVPAFPGSDEYCSDYESGKTPTGSKEQQKDVTLVLHLPYKEKRCPDCHSQEKDVNDGLVAPRNKLCFKCHPEIAKHPRVHGPVADGDCLACHLPHSSSNPALLITSRDRICAECHTEQRLAATMHERLSRKGMVCVDCHDPHSSSSKIFLK
ncbi:cytochrome C [Geomonas nitrogeniifigens]|uniref:Cytochrome C n=1 Tax=Geomonas diazotrophica TaxID=2843197 RepID=A0ABX8JFA0_9BACT|nr:cytochrome c3 family protein [Geomonas nitrogeniifigens]QWV96418.1 cytochrome C [Geomonas nitrogeniifigens]